MVGISVNIGKHRQVTIGDSVPQLFRQFWGDRKGSLRVRQVAGRASLLCLHGEPSWEAGSG